MQHMTNYIWSLEEIAAASTYLEANQYINVFESLIDR